MSDFSQEDRDLLAAEFENFGSSKLFQMYAQQVRSGRVNAHLSSVCYRMKWTELSA